MKTYEEIKAVYLKGAKPIVPPLLSWDFHVENLSRISDIQKDALVLNKLIDKLSLDIDLMAELESNSNVVLVTDLSLRIEFASSNIIEMTGYLSSEVVGNYPNMFQGVKTDRELSKKIKDKINKRESFDEVLVNYRKNKSVYNCRIKGFPIFNKKGDLVKYVAVEQAA